MSTRRDRGAGQRRRRRAPLIATLVVLALLAGTAGWYVFGRTDSARTVYADFSYVNGIYQGSGVTVLGVPVGKVTEVTPKGTFVRVKMTMESDVKLPAGASAYVLNPSVISDRHVELGPAYRGGPELADGAEIPIERSHAPIDFDTLMGSIKTLTAAVGPGGGDLGSVLTDTAKDFDGTGKLFNTAVRNLSAATGVVGANSGNLTALVNDVQQLVSAMDSRQVSADQLVRELGTLGDQWSAQHIDITQPLQDLRVVLDQMNTFIAQHGNDVGSVAQNLKSLGDTLSQHQGGVAEFMDLVPLMMQNMGKSIGPDQRGRIRLNVSSALTQFAVAKPLCDKYRLPLCTGAGFTNPISFPISASDPLGIVSALTGGAAPGGR